MAEPLNLLFTSVGRRVALLKLFRRAFDELELPGRIVAVDHSPHAAALQFADTAHLVPSIDEPEYHNALMEVVERNEVCVVFPLIDPDVPVLAAMRSRLAARGSHVATVAEAFLSAVGDKWEAGRQFAELGISRPRAWLPEQLDEIPQQYPLFIKPRDGSASGHCYTVRSERELRFFAEYVPRPIIQEYLPGPEITNDVICDVRGNVLDVISRERMQVRGGEVTVGRTVHDAEIADSAARIARAVGATGPITVQCIMKGSHPCFTEINARLGGGVTCGPLAGATWPRNLVASLAGLPVTPRTGPSYRPGVVFSRYHDAVEARPVTEK